MALRAEPAVQLPCLSPIGRPVPQRPAMAGGEPGVLRFVFADALPSGVPNRCLVGTSRGTGSSLRSAGGMPGRCAAGATVRARCRRPAGWGRPGTMSALGNDAPVMVGAASGKALIRMTMPGLAEVGGAGEGAGFHPRSNGRLSWAATPERMLAVRSRQLRSYSGVGTPGRPVSHGRISAGTGRGREARVASPCPGSTARRWWRCRHWRADRRHPRPT